jgi:hypothetical protein
MMEATYTDDDAGSGISPSLPTSTQYTHDTKATTLKLETQGRLLGEQDTLYAPSISESMSSTSSHQSEGDTPIVIPSRPKGENGEWMSEFICPYCQVPQMISTERKWR